MPDPLPAPLITLRKQVRQDRLSGNEERTEKDTRDGSPDLHKAAEGADTIVNPVAEDLVPGMDPELLPNGADRCKPDTNHQYHADLLRSRFQSVSVIYILQAPPKVDLNRLELSGYHTQAQNPRTSQKIVLNSESQVCRALARIQTILGLRCVCEPEI